MRNFEERYTAWLDGALDERERMEFEAELPDLDAARTEAEGWGRLRGMLRESLVPEPAPHGDFLNSQVLREIEAAAPRPATARYFPIGRLAWAGALLLAIAGVLSAILLPEILNESSHSPYISQVLATHAPDSRTAAYSFAAPGGKGTVLWVQDAGDIPADEKP